MSATSDACVIVRVVLVDFWRTTRHTDKRATLHTACSRQPADQSGKRMTSWTGKSPDTRDILITSSRGRRSCRARMSRGCYEETAPVEFSPNSVNHWTSSAVYVNGGYGGGGRTGRAVNTSRRRHISPPGHTY